MVYNVQISCAALEALRHPTALRFRLFEHTVKSESVVRFLGAA